MLHDSDASNKLRIKIQELEEQDEQDLAELEKLLIDLEYVESEESLYSYLVAAWEYFDPAPFHSLITSTWKHSAITSKLASMGRLKIYW